MKKEYICPQIECVRVEPTVLYTGSPDGDVIGPVGVRRHLLHEDDEFYEDDEIYEDSDF